jgi:N-acetylglucosaminyldiphosphoundecaprenol N-acetyl-beta-D-mannosaminyltransferase
VDGPIVDVLGVHISALDLERATEVIVGWIASGAKQYVCVRDVHGVMESRRDPALRDIHNQAGMTTPDGMPIVWAARYAGVRNASRVYGPDLMLQVAEALQRRGYSSFFYGSTPDTVEKLIRRLREQFPRLEIAGSYQPPFRDLSPDEEDQIADAINAAAPQVVWVGLSTPKQERWMARNRHRLEANVLVGVGAAFDFHAGTVRQAPRWIQRSGFEWLYRLAREPRRLWRRYLRNIPAFVAAILREPPRLVHPGAGGKATDGTA